MGINWLINWPLAVLLIVILILCTLRCDSNLRRALGRMGRGVRSISVSGVEVALNPETAPELSADFKQTISALRQLAQKHYGYEANVHDLQQLLKQFMTEALPHKIDKTKEDVLQHARATIHVPDIVFKDALYQIVDY